MKFSSYLCRFQGQWHSSIVSRTYRSRALSELEDASSASLMQSLPILKQIVATGGTAIALMNTLIQKPSSS